MPGITSAPGIERNHHTAVDEGGNAIETPDALFRRAATTFAELSPALIAIRGEHGRFTFVNAAWTRLLGWSAEELVARPFLDFVADDDRARTAEAVRLYESGSGPSEFVNRFKHIDGSLRTLLWKAIYDPHADATYGIATDVTERVAAEERRATLVAELERRGRQLTHIVELGRFAGSGAPLSRVVLAAARALAHGLGSSHAAVYLGAPGNLAYSAGYGYEGLAAAGDRIDDCDASQIGRTIETCVPFVCGSGTVARTPLQTRAGIDSSLTVPILRTVAIGVLCADDIAPHRFDIDDVAFAEACAALVAAVASLDDPAAIRMQHVRRDVVVPTRDAFERILEARRTRSPKQVVLTIDVPRGRDDAAVLACIDTVLPGALIGREESRRFLVAAPADADGDAAATAERLRKALADGPFSDELGARPRLLIGVARLPEDGADSAGAIAAAELAATTAAQAGQTGVSIYHSAMTAAAHFRSAIRLDLRQAIDNEEFFLLFQPIVDARHGTIVAFEALVRWDHPQAGIIPPNEFIAIAEETGDIVALTRWVLREATKQCRTWQRHAHDTVGVTVNVSAVDLADPAFIESVTRALRSASLPARYLTIEVTESALMDDIELASRTLSALRSFGATTALDDFGTGYSSLAYLKRLPFDALKIDRAFVREIATSEHDLVLADAIVAVAKKFSMRVTAEGVETPEQARILRALGCDSLQGYLFARPVASGSVETLLRMPPPVNGFAETDDRGEYRAS